MFAVGVRRKGIRCRNGMHSRRNSLQSWRRRVRTCAPRGSVRHCACAHAWEDGTTLDEVIQLEHVTKRFGQFVAVDDADFGIGQRRVLRDARSVRLRQDHDAAHDRRLRGADRRARSGSRARTSRRSRRTSATSTPSSSSTRCSRTCRCTTTSRSVHGSNKVAEDRGQAARRRAARDRAPHRLRAPQAEPALRRSATARRARPRARQLPERAAARRAARPRST